MIRFDVQPDYEHDKIVAYRHFATYGDQTLYFARLPSPKLSKRLVRAAKMKLFRNMRPQVKGHPDSIWYTIDRYNPERWRVMRADLRLRRATINQAKTILQTSKCAARNCKIKLGYKYTDRLSVTVPQFGVFNIEASKQKLEQAKEQKRAATRTPVTFPDFIRFEIKQVDDYDGDSSFLGQFTNHWEPGAINHYAKQYGHDGKDSHTYKWFVPENSYESQKQALRKCGFCKVDADRIARFYTEQAYKRANDYGDQWSFVGVVVTAYVGETEVGEASLWGIETDSGQAYFDEIAYDLKCEIVHSLDIADLTNRVNQLQELIETLPIK
jgi:hypothetical protein